MIKNVLLIFFLLLSSLAISQDFLATEIKTFSGYEEYVYQTRISPYGNYIALTIGNNSVELYDKNYKKLWTSQGNPRSVGGHVAFSPDEKYLCFSKYKTDHDIGVLRLSDLKVIQTLSEQGHYIQDLAYSPDGKYLAAPSRDYTIHVWKWDTDDFKDHYELIKYESEPNTLAFSPDGQYLVSGFQDGTVKVFQLKNNKYQESVSIPGNKYSVEAITFHPSGKYFVTGGGDFAVRVFNKEGSGFKVGKEIKDEWGGINEVAFSPDGKYLATARSNSDINIWKTDGGNLVIEKVISRHNSYTFDVSFSNDGKYLTSSSHDKSSIIWQLKGIGPSPAAFIQQHLSSNFTSAQRKVIGSNASEKILAKVDKTLSAPKDEFETNQDYQKRKEKLKAHILFLLQQETEIYFKASTEKGKTFFKIDRMEAYDADQELYTFFFLDTKAKVTMPVAEAKALKENFPKAKISCVKTLAKDGQSYNYNEFTLIHPTSGSSYQITISENPFNATALTAAHIEGHSRTGSDDVEDPAQYDLNSIPGKNYALLFATNDYENYPDLQNPLNDARTIAKELKASYSFEAEVVENPTMEEILTKLREYAQKSYNPKDQFFIFIAGHGKYDEVFKEGYLVMKESKHEDENKTTLLSHSNLRTIINNIPCDHIFLTMDVCFGGTFDPHIASRGTDVYNNITKSEFIERKLALKTRLYLTSGGKEYVPDGRPGEHSPFARKFLEALRSYGGEDGILTTSEILSYIEKVVPQPRTGEFGKNEPGSDFIFIAK